MAATCLTWSGRGAHRPAKRYGTHDGNITAGMLIGCLNGSCLCQGRAEREGCAVVFQAGGALAVALVPELHNAALLNRL